MLPQISAEMRVGVDPELRFTPSGVAVCSLRAVASSRRKNESTGEWEDDKTTWLTVVGFKRVAENMAESLSKGDLIIVTGRLEVQEWEDNTGSKRITPQILVDTIGPSLAFATARPARSESTGGGGQQQARQSAPSEDPWAAPQQDEPPF